MIESIACWLAFLTRNQHIATVAALSAILVHAPSAYYQALIAFGAKGLMIAAYFFVTSLHLFSSLKLFLEPTSLYWLLNTFLIHNIYVWCRVLYFLFSAIGLFSDKLYTNSVLLSTFTLLPAVLGISANMLFLGYVTVSVILYFAIVQPDDRQRERFVNECTRNLLVNKVAHQTWKSDQLRLMKMKNVDQLTDRERAKYVFDQWDTNKNGSIDGDEITELLEQWEASPNFVKQFVNGSHKREITFESFYKNIWCLVEASASIKKATKKREGMAKARFVFNQLDCDSNGFIDGIELQKLLIQWGLPDNEVDAYLADDVDRRFSFEEFYQNLRPIWEFAYENISFTKVD